MNLEEEKARLEAEKTQKLNDYNTTYDQLLNERKDLTNQQNSLIDNYTNTQSQLANDQLAYQEELINQKRQKEEESFKKEAKSSYGDYQDFINPYGVQRESQAQNGVSNSGYSESTKTTAYTTHQNRIATARTSLKEAQLQFDNLLKEAQLQNNSKIAELALTQLQQKLELALSDFDYKNTVTQNKISYQDNTDNNYYARYQDILDQINYEKQQEEAIRQFNADQTYKQEQAKLAQQQWEKQFAYQQQQDSITNAQNWANINAKKTEQIELTSPTFSNDFNQQLAAWASGSYGKLTQKDISAITESVEKKLKAGTMTEKEADIILTYLGL